MVVELFASLLEELSKIMHYQLHVDHNNSCMLHLPTGLDIQLEIHRHGTHFIIGTDLGNIPVGKYRENLFREALRANGFPPPQYGTFAYSKQKDSLILFSLLVLKDLTGQRIADHLIPFMEKAVTWQTAIKRGDVPVVSLEKTSGSAARPFGM